MYQRLGLTLKPEVLFWNTWSACDTPKPKFKHIYFENVSRHALCSFLRKGSLKVLETTLRVNR